MNASVNPVALAPPSEAPCEPLVREAAPPATPAVQEVQEEPAPPSHPRGSAASIVTATLAVIVAMWWGQTFLIPLACGLALSLLVMPLADALECRLKSGAAASSLSLLLVMGVLVGGGWLFGAQFVRVAERVPYMISMAAQQLSERDPESDSVLVRARNALQQLERAADRVVAGKPVAAQQPPPRARRAAAQQAAAAAPLPASAASAPAASNTNITATATEALRDTAVTGSGIFMQFLGHLAVIFFIAFFVLTGGRPLAVRFLGLWGYSPDAHQRATLALHECGRQIRIYAGVLLITNTMIGVVVWITFMLVGLPDAGGWGVTAGVLHMLPYAGMAVLTVLGAAETLLARGTLGAALGMAGFLVLMSTLIGTLVAAWLQGRAARMNPAAVFIGLVFWGAMWGLWGLFLGPMLVVAFKVIAEHTASGHRIARLLQG